MKIELNKSELEEILSNENGLEKLKELALEKNPEILHREKRWEEFGEVEGYFIHSYSKIVKIDNKASVEFMKNTYPTKKEAEMALAMCQLLQWRDKANGCKIDEWCDWSDTSQVKYTIERYRNEIRTWEYNSYYNTLVFKNEKIADQFLKDHKTLIKKAFGL